MIHLRSITFILGVVLMLVGAYFAVGWPSAVFLAGLIAAYGSLKISVHLDQARRHP